MRGKNIELWGPSHCFCMLSDLRLEMLVKALPILGRSRGGKAGPVAAGLGAQGKLAHDQG